MGRVCGQNKISLLKSQCFRWIDQTTENNIFAPHSFKNLLCLCPPATASYLAQKISAYCSQQSVGVAFSVQWKIRRFKSHRCFILEAVPSARDCFFLPIHEQSLVGSWLVTTTTFWAAPGLNGPCGGGRLCVHKPFQSPWAFIIVPVSQLMSS